MSNPGFLSKRQRKKPQSGLTSDRYEYLGLDQSEADLGDPLVGVSSIGAKPKPVSGDIFVLAAYSTRSTTGISTNRFWVPTQDLTGGLSLTPGSFTVFNNDVQVGLANSFNKFNFVGTGVTVDPVGVSVNQQTGIATVRISVTDAVAKGGFSAVQYHGAGGLIQGAGDFVFDPNTNQVGIGSTLPQQKLNVIGNILVNGISTFSSGPVIINSLLNTETSNQKLQVTGGAYISDNIGIGTTNAKSKLHVIGDSLITGILTVSNGIQGIGIQSGGTNITTSVLSTLNFVGAGNSFSYNSATKTVDINIGGSQWTFTDTSNILTSDIYREFGNVGIRTTNPTSTLTVVGSGTSTSQLFVTGVSTFAGISTFTKDVFVGSGTTIYVTNFADRTGSTGVSGARLVRDGNGVIWTTEASTNIAAAGTIGNVQFQNSNGLLGANNGFHYDFTTNRVGIGSTIPGATLQVTPTSTSISGLFSGTTSNDMVRITQLGTGNALVVEDESNPDVTPFVVTGIGSVGIGTTNPLGSLQVGAGTSAFVVTSTGSVGIGITDPGQANLAIVNVNNSQATFSIGQDVDGSGSDHLGIYYGSNGNGNPIGVNAANIFTSNGNMRFDVDGNGSAGSSFAFGRALGGATWVVIDSSGNVGIGTTNPTNTLTVVGSGTSTSQLFVSGVSTFAGITTVTGTTLFAKQLNVSGIASFTTLSIPVGGSISVEGITLNALSIANPTLTSLNVTGLSTFAGITTVTGPTLFSKQLNVSGIATVRQLSDYKALIGAASSTTETFVVTVAAKTSNHRYFGTGSSEGYYIDGKESPFITLLPGKTYRFDQSHASNSGHPILFYLDANKTTQYTTNVTTTGTAGSGGYVEITITDLTPIVLYYQCSAHAGMGNSVQTNSNSIISPHNFNVSGIATFSNNVVLGDASSDTVTYVSRVGSGITPSSDNTHELGSSSLRWKKIFVGEVIGTLTGAASSLSVTNDTANENRFLVLSSTTANNGISTVLVNSGVFYNPNTNSLGVVGIITSKHLEITGITTLKSLGVSGITTTENLNVSGVTTIGSAVTITSSGINASGINTLGTLNVSGVTIIGSAVTITSSGINASGINTLGTLNVSGVSTFAGITTVTGSTLFAKQLNVSGISTFAKVKIIELQDSNSGYGTTGAFLRSDGRGNIYWDNTPLGILLPTGPFGAAGIGTTSINYYKGAITRGYTLGGYNDSVAYKKVYKTNHSTDTTTDLGAILTYYAAYTDAASSENFAYTFDSHTSSAHNASGDKVNKLNMVTDTNVTNSITMNAAKSMNTNVIQYRFLSAYVFGDTNPEKFQFSNETPTVASTSWTDRNSLAAFQNGQGDDRGYISKTTNVGYQLEFSTESWTSWSPPSGTATGDPYAPLSTYTGHIYWKTNATNFRKMNSATATATLLDITSPSIQEENYHTGESKGYMVGGYTNTWVLTGTIIDYINDTVRNVTSVNAPDVNSSAGGAHFGRSGV